MYVSSSKATSDVASHSLSSVAIAAAAAPLASIQPVSITTSTGSSSAGDVGDEAVIGSAHSTRSSVLGGLRRGGVDLGA